MKYRVCILVTVVFMFLTTANADNWKKTNFRKNSSSWSRMGSYSGSWNYKGSRLNGVTHGGGFVNDWTQKHQSWSSPATDVWTHNGGIGEVRQEARRNYNALNGSSSYKASAAGSRVRLVSGNPWTDRQRYTGGGGGGAETVREYRYAPQKGNEGVALSTASNVRMNVPSKQSSSEASAVGEKEEDASGPMHIGRNGTGSGPSGKSGAGAAADGPLGEGLLPLALLALALAAWKKMR